MGLVRAADRERRTVTSEGIAVVIEITEGAGAAFLILFTRDLTCHTNVMKSCGATFDQQYCCCGRTST